MLNPCLVIMSFFAVTSCTVHAFEYEDASTHKFINSAIAKARDEKICVRDSGEVARSMVFTVNENFHAIKSVLLSEIMRAGLEVDGCKRRKLEESISFSSVDYIAQDFDLDSAESNELGSAMFQHSHEYFITVDQYNIDPKIAGVSSLRIRLIDAGRFLGKDKSIVIIHRIDRWKGWAQIPWTKIPLPYKVQTSESLVGEYEVQLIERAFTSIEAQGFAFSSDKGFAQLKDSNLLIKIMAHMDEDKGASQNGVENNSTTNSPHRGAVGESGSESSNP